MSKLSMKQRINVIAGFAGADHRTAAKFLRGEPVLGESLLLRLQEAAAKLAQVEAALSSVEAPRTAQGNRSKAAAARPRAAKPARG